MKCKVYHPIFIMYVHANLSIERLKLEFDSWFQVVNRHFTNIESIRFDGRCYKCTRWNHDKTHSYTWYSPFSIIRTSISLSDICPLTHLYSCTEWSEQFITLASLSHTHTQTNRQMWAINNQPSGRLSFFAGMLKLDGTMGEKWAEMSSLHWKCGNSLSTHHFSWAKRVNVRIY